jgi:GNAT superfamily N-acetyltransferase
MSSVSAPYRLVARLPRPDEYRALCRAVGWERIMPVDAGVAGLPASLVGAVVEHDGAAVAMARVVGDGALYFYLQDVVVHPEHQRRGLGAALMTELMGWIRARAADGAFVGLFAAPGSEPLYRRHGFGPPSGLTGMVRVLSRSS